MSRGAFMLAGGAWIGLAIGVHAVTVGTPEDLLVRVCEGVTAIMAGGAFILGICALLERRSLLAFIGLAMALVAAVGLSGLTATAFVKPAQWTQPAPVIPNEDGGLGP